MADYLLHTVAMELALGYAGYNFPRLSQVVHYEKMQQYPVRFPMQNNGFGIAVLDITLTDEGKIHLIEANGSNSGMTSVAFGHDYARAEHMFLSWQNRQEKELPAVVLLPFKPDSMHLSEFFSRAYIFAKLLSSEQEVALRHTDENCAGESVAIICGPIPDIAYHISCENNNLFYKKRKISYACNTNILPELLRRGVIIKVKEMYNIRTDYFQDGGLVRIIHDKAMQQSAALCTGITPLLTREAWSVDECADAIKDFHARGLTAVGKMHAGSGGIGIEFFPPSGTHDIESKLAGLIASAQRQYGDEIILTMFPIRIFEFVRSTGLQLSDGLHLWDMRMQCLIYPGYVDITPCLVRICPAPFDGLSYDRKRVVSNLTGRKPSVDWIRSPFDNTVLREIGVDGETLKNMIASCARWCESAWRIGTLD